LGIAVDIFNRFDPLLHYTFMKRKPTFMMPHMVWYPSTLLKVVKMQGIQTQEIFILNKSLRCGKIFHVEKSLNKTQKYHSCYWAALGAAHEEIDAGRS
jgi:hypothetical protein